MHVNKGETGMERLALEPLSEKILRNAHERDSGREIETRKHSHLPEFQHMLAVASA